MLGLVEQRPARRLCDPRQDGAPRGGRCRQGQGDRALLPGRRGEPAVSEAAGRQRLQGARSQDRALEHPRHRQPHRRPRPEDGAPDRRRGRRAAARPRLGAVHPRRDAGAGGRHARHRRGRAVHRRARTGPTRRRSCCTTTSRRSRSARPAAWAGRGRREIGHGKLAWRAIHPMLPLQPRVPLHHPRGVGDHRVRTARRRWRRCAAPRSR